MRAIITKYFPPGNTRGARIKADAGQGVTLSMQYPHELSRDAAHEAAARALMHKMGWNHTIVNGSLPNGDEVFVMVPRGKNPAPRIGTKKPKRASQREHVTKTGKLSKAASSRLVKRRETNKKPGYFPNPKPRKAHKTRLYVYGEHRSGQATMDGEYPDTAKGLENAIKFAKKVPGRRVIRK